MNEYTANMALYASIRKPVAKRYTRKPAKRFARLRGLIWHWLHIGL